MSYPDENHDLAKARKEAEKMPKVAGVHFSAPFIKRPVASLPQVEFPVISVGAGLPGADPETVASAIVTPLERQFSRIAGINEMTSSSGLGNGSIALQFDLSRDVNGAARDVQ